MESVQLIMVCILLGITLVEMMIVDGCIIVNMQSSNDAPSSVAAILD